MICHIEDRPYTCPDCGRGFKRSHEVKNHIASIHEQSKKFHCNQCTKIFKTKHGFLDHISRHLKQFVAKCEACGKGFVTKQEYDAHMKKRHNDNRETLICFVCGRTCVDKASLTGHLRTHEEGYHDEKFSCEYCGKKFAQKRGLDHHYIRKHKDGGERFICDLCGKEVNSKRSLKGHMLLHQGVKPVQCPHCEKSFALQSTLKQHILTHTGERPHKCEECGKSFTQRGPLKAHMRAHSGELPYLCGICSNAFTSKAQLNYHVKSNTDSESEEDKEKVIYCKKNKGTTKTPVRSRTRKAKNVSTERVNLGKSKTSLLVLSVPANKPSRSVKKITTKKVSPSKKVLSLRPVSSEYVADEICNFLRKRGQAPSTLGGSEAASCLPVKTNMQASHNVLSNKAEPSSERIPITDPAELCSSTLIVKSENLEAYKPLHVEPFKPPFSCSICDSKFEHFDELESHLKSTEKQHSYQCEVCLQCLDNYDSLCEHMERHKNYKYKCFICDIIQISIGDFQKHLRKHRYMIPLLCNSCDQTFYYQWALRKHIKTYHGFSCEKCSVQLLSVTELIGHYRDMHYLCEMCQKVFDDADSLFQHEKEAHGECITCPICQQAHPDIKSLEEHKMKVHETVVSLLCSTCGRMFKNKSTLDKHLKFHDREKGNWPCEQCDKVYEFKVALQKHQTSKHKNVNMCDTCGKVLSSPFELIRHKMAHDGIKPEECDICHKKFRRRTNLKSHRRSHTGEKPYECNLCGHNFGSSKQLVTHIKNKHDVCDNTYVCSHCDKKFPTNVALNYHIKSQHEFTD